MNENTDERYARIARAKIMPGSAGDGEGDALIGHSFYNPGEVVVKHWTEEMTIGREREPVHITVTRSNVPFSGQKSGRVLLSYDPEAHVTYGGAFAVEGRKGIVCVNDLYIAKEYRGGDIGTALARVLRRLKIRCVYEPISTAGRSWAGRHRFRVVRGS